MVYHFVVESDALAVAMVVYCSVGPNPLMFYRLHSVNIGSHNGDVINQEKAFIKLTIRISHQIIKLFIQME